MKTQVLKIFVIYLILLMPSGAMGQTPGKIPDTGQTQDYTGIFGEDSDYLINAPSFRDNGNKTITDNITGLTWQKEDGGEMTWDSALSYCAELVVGNMMDWRLPNPHEAFMILDHSRLNPALNTDYFTVTKAQYWWCSHIRVDDNNRAWATNSGGGIGPHLKSETISAGGDKKYHARCVTGMDVNRVVETPGNGTIRDYNTGLQWQQFESPEKMSWESALEYCENLNLAKFNDWRLPNIKELQSLSSYLSIQPAIDQTLYPATGPEPFWSSTTMLEPNSTGRAWMLDFKFGIVSYREKNEINRVRAVRSIGVNTGLSPWESKELRVGAFVGADGNLSVIFNTPVTGNILTIYGPDGRMISRIVRDKQPAGTHTALIKIPGTSPGVYILCLFSGGQKACHKFLIH